MVSLASLKPFLPFLLTFLLPRALGYYRVVKTAIRTRPAVRPLPAKTSQGLNVLFASICVFFFLTLPLGGFTPPSNIFTLTNSRVFTSTDLLFTRLASHRPNGALAPLDESLKTVLTTPVARQLYLRLGPATLAHCPFCDPDDPQTYLLYHLPSTLLPHLFNILALGVATSSSIGGLEANRWRIKLTLGALSLSLLDTCLTATYAPKVDGQMPSPPGIFWTASILRPLVLACYNALAALLIYASATNRFLLFVSPSESDPAVARSTQEHQLAHAALALQMAQTKLRAFQFARNAVVRDPALKGVDDEYWRAVVAMEGPGGGGGGGGGGDGVWQEEEVQAAIAGAMGGGQVDVERVEKEAEAMVANITKGLEGGA